MHPNDSPHEILHSVFGYEHFRGNQEAIIKHTMANRDALVLMPTGGGKSLCYQIPALMHPGVGIVVSPLISLMQDQVSALQQLGVHATFINSSLMTGEALRREDGMLQNQYDLVYVAPERLLTERFLDCLDQTQLALFAIDEAHCVSQWGHDFRPEYIQLSVLKKRFPKVPCIALTATADVPTRREIVDKLELDNAQIFCAGFDRPNIHYRVLTKNNSRQQLLRFIREEHPRDSGIVYCLSRKRVEAIAMFLANSGYPALPYHAGLPADLRQTHQHRFLREDNVIIVATVAFGMGIDKPDVRFVAHMDLPKSLEAYYQETGRAGRDGSPADAWMSYGIADVVMLRQMLSGSNAEQRVKRMESHKLDAMLGYCEATQCRRLVLLNYFGEHLSGSCGNCDTCLEPVENWNGSEAAQKAMSCVYRTGQRFGVTYLVEVLRGKTSARISQFRHDRLSTYGIGGDLDERQWKSVYRQLVAMGLLAVDMEGYGGLKLTTKSRPVLRGEEVVYFRKDPVPATKTSRKVVTAARFDHSDDKNSKALWETLRNFRLRMAEEQNVPPFVIFHDSTLKEIVIYRPADSVELQQLSGIGQSKLQKYGDDILSTIKQHEIEWGPPTDRPPIPLGSQTRATQPDSLGLSETVATTVELIKQGNSTEVIVAKRSLKRSTIYAHLAEAIEAGEIEPSKVIDLAEDEIKVIESAFVQLDPEFINALKPVFEILGEQYDYDVLRCVRAGMIVRGDFPG